ncbi:MAG: M28 family peptidase [Candidatus Ancaeobacter aquaticus]|nr:M28 family peptidase [Candidatus Ancaeobacter aquaticus]
MNNENSELIENLKKHVIKLSDEIGDRSVFKYEQLCEAEKYITEELVSYGYTVTFQEYTILNKQVKNIIVTRRGTKTPEDMIIVGAHYDSTLNPGADDNASGVAGLLELARFMADKNTGSTIEFAAFPAEEPPFFDSEDMASLVYAKAAKKGKVNIKGVLILEMIGYFDKKPRTQTYPNFAGALVYPNRGDFIAVLGNLKSINLVGAIRSCFKKQSRFPMKPIITFNYASAVHFSDHWAFWQEGYRAVMITDTSFYRNHHYHTETDTYDTLDYESMAEIVRGLKGTLIELGK